MLSGESTEQQDLPRSPARRLLSKGARMTNRTRLFRGIALLAVLVFVALLTARIASPQQPGRPLPMGAETLYASAGVGELGTNASVAWFIATPKSGDSYPVACKFVGESFVCKKGTFQ